MADSTVLQASQQAVERWEVPALAVATSVAGERRQFQLGCDEDARFRIASITKPLTASLAVQLLDLDESTGIWPADVRVRHLLSHVTGYDGEIGDLARFGEGDDALGAAVAELPSVERLVPLEPRGRTRTRATGSRAGWPRGRTARPTRRRSQEHVLGPAGLDEATFGSPSLEGTGPDGAAAATIRARAARRAGSSRPQRRSAASPTGSCGSRGRTRCGYRSAKPPGGVYGLGFFGERVGGDRRLGPPRLLRRLPVHAPARAEPRRLARRH